MANAPSPSDGTRHSGGAPPLDFVLEPAVDTKSASASGTANETPGPAGPIADLSYRSYDGPLHTRAIRWWIVALAGMRLSGRKKTGFWILASIGALPYVFQGLMLYLFAHFPKNMGESGIIDLTVGQKYASALFTALNWQLFLLLIMGLLVGAGSIAADNQTNALLVYLAKPITKSDYLIGKWVGIFVLLFAAVFVPGLILYLFCLISYTSEGFLRQEPWLIVRLVGASIVPAAVFASLLVGISAWSKSPTMAGAIQAGLYFASGTFPLIAIIPMLVHQHGDPTNLFTSLRFINVQHASVNGAIMGLVQNIYGVTFHMMTGPRRGFEQFAIRPPTLWMMLSACILMVVTGIAAARARIRAVEVVRG